MEAPRIPEKLADVMKTLGVECRPEDAHGFRFRFYHQDKPLKTLWSPAALDDLRAYHGLDAEKELVDIVVAELRHEVTGAPL